MAIREEVGTIKRLIAHFDKASIFLLGVTIVAAIVAVTLYLGGSITGHAFGVWTAAVTVTFCASFMRPLVGVASEGCGSVFSVCITGGTMFTVFLVGFYSSYYFVVGNLGTQGSSLAKILDLPPLLVALWAAGTGWYVTFQLGRRNQRTSHAVNLVLSTRTNSEFQKHSLTVRRLLPKKADVDAIDPSFFGVDALKLARVDFDKDDPVKVARLNQARGITSLKYLLNYYEFMAVGIDVDDIDEDMVYETIGAHVIQLFERAQTVKSWLNDSQGGNEMLAWCHLDSLIGRWKVRAQADKAKQVARSVP